MPADAEKLLELRSLLVSMSEQFQTKLIEISNDFKEQLSASRLEINEDMKKRLKRFKKIPVKEMLQ